MTPEQAALLFLLDRIETLEALCAQQIRCMEQLRLRLDRLEREARSTRVRGVA